MGIDTGQSIVKWRHAGLGGEGGLLEDAETMEIIFFCRVMEKSKK
jgi:hypothetical protein